MIVGWIYHGKTEIYEAYLNGTLIWSASLRRLAGGQLNEALLFLVGPGLGVLKANKIQMLLNLKTGIEAGGKIQEPESILLFGVATDLQCTNGNIETRPPDAILQYLFWNQISNARGRVQSPENLNGIADWELLGMMDAGQTQRPADIWMFTHGSGIKNASAKVETPEDVLQSLRLESSGYTHSTKQKPSEVLFHMDERYIDLASGKTQKPGKLFLFSFERGFNIMRPMKQAPDAALLELTGRATGKAYSKLWRPETLRMELHAEDSGLAVAGLKTPADIFIRTQFASANTAAAELIDWANRFRVFSSGCAEEWLRCVVSWRLTIPTRNNGTIEMLSPVGSAWADPHSVLDGVDGGCVFELLGHGNVDSSNGAHGDGYGYFGHLIGSAVGIPCVAVKGAGIVYLPNLLGYGDGNTAETVEGRGQPIALEFSCRMWGNAAIGRAFTIRMHATLGDIAGHANGHNAGVVRGAGVYCEIPELIGPAKPKQDEPNVIHLDAEVGSIVRGGCSSLIGSVPTSGVLYLENLCGHAGGYVKMAEVTGWADPIQIGSNLYIRSAWISWNDGDNLHIDIPEFYVPVREGSNLHIRTVWFSYKDQSEVCIDTDIFYKPEKSGSNLHIRSVDTIWTDGSAGNVDTDYFLDPIRTGNNLHIRSDVFGGE